MGNLLVTGILPTIQDLCLDVSQWVRLEIRQKPNRRSVHQLQQLPSDNLLATELPFTMVEALLDGSLHMEQTLHARGDFSQVSEPLDTMLTYLKICPPASFTVTYLPTLG